MGASRRVTAATLTAAVLLLSTGCDMDPTPIGTMQVSVTTGGGDPDRDGYRLLVNGTAQESVGVVGSSLLDLAAGTYDVELAGLAVNCAVIGDNPRAVQVYRGIITAVGFEVLCRITGVTVSATTSGIDLDTDGFQVVVDTAPPTPLSPGGTVNVSYLSPGPHSVSLVGLAPNCAVAPPHPRPVTVDIGLLTAVAFNVTCTAATGVLEIALPVTGLDQADTLSVKVDSAAPVRAPANGTAFVAGLSPGTHQLTVTSTAANCGVAGANPRTVTITAGAARRDTTRVSVGLTCVAATGVLEVTTVTTGNPGAAYQLVVSSGTRPISANETITMHGLAPGTHTLTLSVPFGCAHAGGPVRTAVITAGTATRDTARVTYAVDCPYTTGAVRIHVSTVGLDPDPDGYTVSLLGSGGTRQVSLGSSDSAILDKVPAGDYVAALAGVAGNCTVGAPNPRPITVTAGGTTPDTVSTAFSVTCTAVSGWVRVTTATTGVDPDPNGYQIKIQANAVDRQLGVGANDVVTVAQVPPGTHLVSLAGLTVNCDPIGAGATAVVVTTGDTTDVGFNVLCQAAGRIAFIRGGEIHTGLSNGTGVQRLPTPGITPLDPAWSPDGSRLAFTGWLGNLTDIFVMNADGTGLTQLTTHGMRTQRPRWSPDGARIAFESGVDGNANIWVINADGTQATRLTLHAADDGEPSWSPDGLRLAFVSWRDGNAELYVMNRDGTGQVRQTVDPREDRNPAWSPDGLQLAFERRTCVGDYWYYYYSCDGDIWLLGTGPLSTGGDDSRPAWSPDGRWIAFAANGDRIRAVRSNGTRTADVMDDAVEPAWKP